MTANLLANGSDIELNWTAQDDPNGIGVKDYIILVSTNNGPFETILSEFEGTSFVYMNGLPGNTYGFISLGRDSVDNIELEKQIADAEITIEDCQIGQACDDGNACTTGETFDEMCNLSLIHI